MAYNLGTVRAAVENRLDDEYEQEFLDSAINNAQWDLLNNRQLTLTEKFDTVVIGTGEVTGDLPTDFQKTLNLIRLGSNPKSIRDNYTDFEEFLSMFPDNEGNPASEPMTWTRYGNQILLSAPTDGSYSLKLYYIKTAPKLVDDLDVPLIPENFQELLVTSAYMRIQKREDDYDLKDKEYQDFSKMRADFYGVYSRGKEPGGMYKMRAR